MPPDSFARGSLIEGTAYGDTTPATFG